MRLKFHILSIVTAFSLLIAGNAFCGSTAGPWNITDHTPVQDCSFPAMNGTTLVWQAKGGLAEASPDGSDWEIFLYDMNNQSIVQITDDDSDDLAPQTDGEFVVWQKYTKGLGSQIFLYRIQGGSAEGSHLISPDGESGNSTPKIAAGRIAWTAQSVSTSYENGRIMLYNALNPSARAMVISDPARDCSDPRIDSQQVVWTQNSNDGIETQFTCNLLSDSPLAQPVPEIFIWNRSAAVDGNRKVMTRYDGTDREIVLYNRMDGYVRITDNALTDQQPIVSQNHIAWVADGDIYLSDIAEFMHVQVPDVAGGRGTEFSASWSELSGGVDAYYLDVSTDPDFRSFVEGFRALDVGTVTQYQVDGLTPDTTYYYRVHASVNGSTTALSKSVTVKVSTPAPSQPRGCSALPFVYKLLLR